MAIRILVHACAAISAISVAACAAAQQYPAKPIRIITSEAGGGTDVVARIVAEGMSHGLGQPVVVDNRGAAGGALGAELVAHAPPDGYSLLFQGNNIWLLPLLRKNVPFDPLRDFAPVVLATNSPNILVVHPSLPVKSVKELIALAKASPGQLNYATGLIGGSTHLSPALFNSMAGVNIVQVTYKGGPAAINDVVAGRVQIMFPSMGTGLPFVKAEKLRGLGVTTSRPSELFPELPTIAAAGLPGYEFLNVTCMFAPAKTPPAIIQRVYREVATILNDAENRQRLLRSGNDIVADGPAEFARAMKIDVERMGKVIREANLRDDK